MGDRLAGKVAIVTGGASGIGAATCRLFVRQAARGVVIADVNETAAKALEAELAQSGTRVLVRRLDVTQEDQWIETMGAIVAQYGRLESWSTTPVAAGRSHARPSSKRRRRPGTSCSPPTPKGSSSGRSTRSRPCGTPE